MRTTNFETNPIKYVALFYRFDQFADIVEKDNAMTSEALAH